jgi:hypothetical protein
MSRRLNTDPKHIHIVDDKQRIIAGKIDLPLFKERAQRFQAEEATHTWQPLTHYTATGQTPPTFDDQLDETEAMERRWIEMPCWKVRAEGITPGQYEQVRQEAYLVFNAYTSPTSAILSTYQANSREAGYHEASISAIEVMPVSQVDPGDHE